MTRRSKKEMEYMDSDVRYYLFRTNNNYHAAHELMIKEHLESGERIPYYIKGIKDFIKVSQELASEIGRKEQMAKKDREKQEGKEVIKKYIMSLSKEDMKAVYREYKDKVSHSDKLVLVDIYQLKYADDFQESYIDQQMINVFSRIYKDQLQPA